MLWELSFSDNPGLEVKGIKLTQIKAKLMMSPDIFKTATRVVCNHIISSNVVGIKRSKSDRLIIKRTSEAGKIVGNCSDRSLNNYWPCTCPISGICPRKCKHQRIEAQQPASKPLKSDGRPLGHPLSPTSKQKARPSFTCLGHSSQWLGINFKKPDCAMQLHSKQI